MLVNITEHFIESGREWRTGENPDVPREVAERWIADGKATYDTDGVRDSQSPVSGDTGWRTEAMVKPFAVAPSFNKTTGLSGIDNTTSVKMEVEGHYSAVRFLRVNRGNQALTSGQMVAFATETMAYATSAQIATPIVNGTAYAALAGATDTKGFRAITWSGAASVPSIPSSAGGPQAVLSDWVPMTSVARANGEASGRPVLGYRIEHLGSTNGNWAYFSASANVRDPITSMRGRTIVVGRYGAGGAIADLTAAKVFVVETLNMDVVPIIRFKVPVFSVWGVGDSITAVTGTNTDVHSAWGLKACAELSTPARPVVWSNLGVAGMTSADFWVFAKYLLALGVPAPSMLVLNVASINEFSSTPNIRQAELTRSILGEAVAVCRQYRIPHLCVWGTLPNENITTAPYDQVRKDNNAGLAQDAATMRVVMLDLSALGDGATPEKWVPAYRYDPFHPNEAGQDAVFVPAVKAAIHAAAGL
jgi:hypothetical protein